LKMGTSKMLWLRLEGVKLPSFFFMQLLM
jgi:hypothetical protein